MRMRGLIMAMALIGMLAAGCVSWMIPDNPYEAGQHLAEDYLMAQALDAVETVSAAELAYEALSEIVEGPSPTLDDDALERLVRRQAIAQGIPTRTANVALILGKRMRRVMRSMLGVSPTVHDVHSYLAALKRGIDDTIGDD